MIDDGVQSATSEEQEQVERDVSRLFERLWTHLKLHPDDKTALALTKGAHARYVRGALGKLPGTLDALLKCPCLEGHHLTKRIDWFRGSSKTALAALERARSKRAVH